MGKTEYGKFLKFNSMLCHIFRRFGSVHSNSNWILFATAYTYKHLTNSHGQHYKTNFLLIYLYSNQVYIRW